MFENEQASYGREDTFSVVNLKRCHSTQAAYYKALPL